MSLLQSKGKKVRVKAVFLSCLALQKHSKSNRFCLTKPSGLPLFLFLLTSLTQYAKLVPNAQISHCLYCLFSGTFFAFLRRRTKTISLSHDTQENSIFKLWIKVSDCGSSLWNLMLSFQSIPIFKIEFALFENAMFTI